MNSLPSAAAGPDDRGGDSTRHRGADRWLDGALVTKALLVLNVGMFFVEVIRSTGEALGHASAVDALALGASYPLATLGEARWETLVTACFLHSGLAHIGFNMLALWQVGPLIERAVGAARMAPMYLFAGAFGNLVSVGYTSWHHGATFTVGASGAISGVIAAAMVVSLRVQGWRAPLTQALVRWLALIVVFGVFATRTGSNIDNAAHIGGALAGGAIAALWRRGTVYSERATAGVLTACLAVLAGCVGVVAYHDRTDPFAPLVLEARVETTNDALAAGNCRRAYAGLLAVERLRAGRVSSLRHRVQDACGMAGIQ
ncbi:MAG: rhomboid family intramembrane serine protease [Polyangiaceae bacterium]